MNENSTVWKYKILEGNVTIIDMPAGAEVLTVQVQNQVPCLWVKVTPENTLERRKFITALTGEIIPKGNYIYISTCQMSNGIVLHVFEKIKRHRR